MPKKIKNENGEEVEVYTAEEVQAASEKKLREKLGIGEDDNLDEKLEEIKSGGNGNKDWNNLRNKEKTLRENTLKKFEELGIKAEFKEDGSIQVVDNQSKVMTPEEVARMVDERQAQATFQQRTQSLLSGFELDKREDVGKLVEDLRSKGVNGQPEDLVRMAAVGLGVDTPSNFNIGGNKGNNMPNNNNQKQSTGSFADTDQGRFILKQMGMTDEQIDEGKKLETKYNDILKEGVIEDPNAGEDDDLLK